MSIRTILVVVALLLSIAIGTIIARSRGGSAAGPGGTPRIGLSLDTLKEARWQADADLFTARVKALGGTVMVQSANSDDSAQIRDVQTLLTAGVDVLVIVPHDGKAMAEAVRLAHQQNVPVIAYDRIIRDCDLDLYLSFDNIRVGQLQAQFLVDRLGGKGSIIRIYGSKTDNNAMLFKQGQDNVLKPLIERGDIKVLHEDWAEDWKPENAKRIVNAAISAQPGVKIDGVLASNDGTAGGAIQALLEERITGVLVTGQDAELVALQRIAGGTQAMTVYKPLKKLATQSAELAVQMAKRRPVIANSTVNNGKIDVPSALSDVVVVTKDNIKQTVVADGFQSEADIYRGVAPR